MTILFLSIILIKYFGSKIENVQVAYIEKMTFIFNLTRYWVIKKTHVKSE